MSKPAARLMDMHVCPMQTPAVVPIPHVGGPIVAQGEPRVLIGGMPAACVGDMATCVGPPDVIVMGSFTVLMGGRPAARMGDQTAHGGMIAAGFPQVMIGDAGGGAGSPAAFTMMAARANGAAFTRTSCQSEGTLKSLEGSPLLFTGDPTKKSWIEIELVDQHGAPVAHERYRVIPPDGKPIEGFLDAQGFARIDGIDPGNCRVTFPALDAGNWKPAKGDPGNTVRPVPVPFTKKPRVKLDTVKVRVKGKPGVQAGSAAVRVLGGAVAEGRPSVREGSARLARLGRPGVRDGTARLARGGRPSVQQGTVVLARGGRPSVQQGTVVLARGGRPSVQQGTAVLDRAGRPSVQHDGVRLAVQRRPGVKDGSSSLAVRRRS